MDALIVRARAEGGVIDASSIGFPAHELLTHLVAQHRLLLHGTNNTELEVIEPRPAHDYGTQVEAVVASDDGIWNEWLRSNEVAPSLRVLVRPSDFLLRHVVQAHEPRR
jgi:hypothetical protein